MDHLALVILNQTAGLGHVNEFAQFCSRRERAFAIALARGECVAHVNQQGGQRSQEHSQESCDTGGGKCDAIGMLTAEGARCNTERYVRDNHHDRYGKGHGPPDRPRAEYTLAHIRDEDCRGHGGHSRQEQKNVDVTRTIIEHMDKPRGSFVALAPEFFDAPT